MAASQMVNIGKWGQFCNWLKIKTKFTVSITFGKIYASYKAEN